MIAVVKAYEYLSPNLKMSVKLIQDLNATVVESASANINDVSIGFLI